MSSTTGAKRKRPRKESSDHHGSIGTTAPPLIIGQHDDGSFDEPVRFDLDTTNMTFIAEIQNMLFGFGDHHQPLLETAFTVRQILHEELHKLFDAVCDSASLRNTKSIGIEDFVFVLRKNKKKLHRFLRYLYEKDFRMKDDPETQAANSAPTASQKKRTKIAKDFLTNVDSTGELLALLSSSMPDEDKYQRLLRAEQMSTSLTVPQYLQFASARSKSNFAKKYPQKFREFLLDNHPSGEFVKLTAYATDAFVYFTAECVAELVDMAMLVKMEQRAFLRSSFDPVITILNELQQQKRHEERFGDSTLHTTAETERPTTNTVGDGGVVSTEWNPTESDNEVDGRNQSSGTISASPEPLRPAHFTEALRRFYHQPTSILSSGSRLRPLYSLNSRSILF